jgi:carbonic anhydrase/acetyltransferase-like protein (isoleucine patch superfamily)
MVLAPAGCGELGPTRPDHDVCHAAMIAVGLGLAAVVWVHSGLMEIRHRDSVPQVDPDAYVAPTAVLSGDVRVGPGSCVLAGAVLSSDGGAVEIGANCVIMEHAVLRGTPRHPLTLGDHVLAGPHCYLTGATIGDEVFIATGAMVFNGARVGAASSVALGGAVHIGCVVPPQTRIPIGWVAVGDPARLHPPGEAGPIRAGLEEAGGFLPFVFGTDPTAGRSQQMRTAMRRYATFLAQSHNDDEPIR